MANFKSVVAFIRQRIGGPSMSEKEMKDQKETSAREMKQTDEHPTKDEVRRLGIRVIKEHKPALDWLAER